MAQRHEQNDERRNEQQRVEAELSEEEQKRLNIYLRGGRNVDEQEDERGTLGASPKKSGTFRDQMARDSGTRREESSDTGKP